MRGFINVYLLLFVLIIIALPTPANPLGPPGRTAQESISLQAAYQLTDTSIAKVVMGMETCPPAPNIQMARAWRPQSSPTVRQKTQSVDSERIWPKRGRISWPPIHWPRR
jgi:hypothetical protein